MSSVEIVKIINELREEGKAELEHGDFLKKVVKVLGEGDAGKFSGIYKDSRNRDKPCYNLPKREAHLMVMSESYKVQAAVYDKMVELEETPVKPQYALEDLVKAQSLICSLFNLPESGQVLLFSKFNAIHGNVLALPSYGVDAGTNPTITSGSSRATFSATTLLKQFAIPCSAVKFNQLAESNGFIETKTRPSSGTKTKEYKAIVGEGLKYSKNITSPSNPRETQPHWFEDSFEEFVAKVI